MGALCFSVLARCYVKNNSYHSEKGLKQSFTQKTASSVQVLPCRSIEHLLNLTGKGCPVLGEKNTSDHVLRWQLFDVRALILENMTERCQKDKTVP
jgi:hypothetical protein